MTIILGIDPGSRVTGYGVINHNQGRSEYIDSGCIRLPDVELPERLKHIYGGISELIERYHPHAFSIEQVFMGKNADSALKLGQARGSAIVAAANHDLPVFEYSARQVKQAVVGTGAADKSQIQEMVCHLLKLSGKPQADAADGLGLALCHAHMNQSMVRMAASKVRRRRIR